MNDYLLEPSLKHHRCIPVRIVIIDSIPNSWSDDSTSTTEDHSALPDGAVVVDDGILPSHPGDNFVEKNSSNGKGGARANKRNNKRRGRTICKRSYKHDENATIYASREDLSLMNTILTAQSVRDDDATLLSHGFKCEQPRHFHRKSSHHKEKCHENTLRDGSICKLFRTGDVEELSQYLSGSKELARTLWVPAILRNFSSSSRMNQFVSVNEGGNLAKSSNLEANTDCQQERRIPTIFIPPCLAATLGLHWFHTRANKNNQFNNFNECLVFLQPVELNPDDEDYNHITLTKASHAAIAEIGIPPIKPSLRIPIPSLSLQNTQIDDKQPQREKKGKETDDVEQQLRQFFLRETERLVNSDKLPQTAAGKKIESTIKKSKPRQRLLTMGSIFATSSSNCGNDVRFYKVVSVQSSKEATENEAIDHSGILGSASGRGNSAKAYIVSPDTHLTLLPGESHTLDSLDVSTPIHPQLTSSSQMKGHAWRLPRPSMVSSFNCSIRDETDGNDRSISKVGMDANNTQRCSATKSSQFGRILHPTAREVADALYLQGVVHNHHPPHFNSSRRPRIIHVIGDKENHVGPCVAEAADSMGMRIFQVDGLAAFWAHCSALGTYSSLFASKGNSSSALSGGLVDKLNGLAAALEMASRSSPCVLHIHDIDRELSPIAGHGADVDGRMEEERRILEIIKQSDSSLFLQNMDRHCNACENCVHDAFLSNSTTPCVVVIFSTKTALPPGPILSILQQSSITVSAPGLNYSRWLWDDDVDGTFAEISSSLIGLSADDVIYLRRRFDEIWKSHVGQNPESDGIFDLKSSNDDELKQPQPPLNRTSPTTILEPIMAKLQSIKSLEQAVSNSRGGGSSSLPLSSSSLPNVRWEDIGGMESIRKEIMDAVELPLKYPKLFEGSRRSGILCFGPPGTGKTLVAKAVARECGIPFLSVKGPELLGSYVGESEANVREVFAAARAAASSSTSMSKNGCQSGGYAGASVLFFDELDSLAPRRGETGHGDGVMDRVTATLLAELDSGDGGVASGSEAADPKKKSSAINIIVMGATNRPDLLDPSLLRPGRFDRLLYLGPAKTKEHCLQILLAQTRKFRFEAGIDRASILRKAMESFPPTLSGADLSAVASGALMRGLKRVCDKAEEEMWLINSKRGVENNSEMAVDIDDVMDLWQDVQLEPVMTVDDFVEAAKDIVPSISEQDLKNFEVLQKQFASVV